jgi:Zn-dependent M28 family amino/carboxypeptidase
MLPALVVACVALGQGSARPDLPQALQTVDPTRIEATVKHLAAYPTRLSGTPESDQAADWLADLYRSLGDEQVVFEAFDLRDGVKARNLLITRPGTDPAAPILVIVAHYDSRSAKIRDPAARAPGADDNASGSAAMLELARVLKPTELRRTIVFAACSGEEQGLVGSAALAKRLSAEKRPIAAVINLDMVGHPIDPERRAIVVEDDRGNAHADNDAPSRTLAATLTAAAEGHTRLEPKPGPMYGSDYMPFEAAGYPCVGLFDGADAEPFYHQATDTPEQVDPAYTADVVRLLVAAVLDLANRP